MYLADQAVRAPSFASVPALSPRKSKMGVNGSLQRMEMRHAPGPYT